MEPELSEDQRNELKTKGFYMEKSEYFEEGNIWSQEFFQVFINSNSNLSNFSIKDARENNRVMSGQPIEPGCPVCIIHGNEDKDVPVKLVDKLVKMLPSNGTKQITVTDGDHRLSRPEVRTIKKRKPHFKFHRTST
jgi:pimeloyl-ACP methyl ester carboxylesterase